MTGTEGPRGKERSTGPYQGVEGSSLLISNSEVVVVVPKTGNIVLAEKKSAKVEVQLPKPNADDRSNESAMGDDDANRTQFRWLSLEDPEVLTAGLVGSSEVVEKA